MDASHAPLTIGEVMTPDPIMLHQNDSLDSAARVLDENEIGGVPVIGDNGALVGVLSEADLVRARATEHLWSRWADLSVHHLMHTPVMTADAAMPIEEAARLMERAHVHRLVVVADDQETPIGIISMGDLVHEMRGER